MRVAEVIRTKNSDIFTTEPGSSVREAAALMQRHGVGSLVVLDSTGRLVGIVSERDIVSVLAAHGADTIGRSVSTVMRSEVPFCHLSDTIESVMVTMTNSRARHLPVFDGDLLVGLVSIGDAVKGRLAELEHEANLVQEYVNWGR